MNTQTITGKEKIVTFSPTDVNRIVDPCNHNMLDNNNNEFVKGDDNYNDTDTDDYSLSSELLQDNQNSATASWDSAGTISYLFTDEEYDYRKSLIDKDDIDDDDDNDDDTEGDEKNALPKYYINNNINNEPTTTGMLTTTNRRRVLKRNQNKSQLSDITFDSGHHYDSNELISLNNDDSMTSLRFAPMMPRRSSNSSSTTNPPSMPVRNHSNH